MDNEQIELLMNRINALETKITTDIVLSEIKIKKIINQINTQTITLNSNVEYIIKELINCGIDNTNKNISDSMKTINNTIIENSNKIDENVLKDISKQIKKIKKGHPFLGD